MTLFIFILFIFFILKVYFTFNHKCGYDRQDEHIAGQGGYKIEQQNNVHGLRRIQFCKLIHNNISSKEHINKNSIGIMLRLLRISGY